MVSIAKYKNWVVYFLFFTLLFRLLVTYGKVDLQFDSYGYWRLGAAFIKDGHFSIFNYTKGLRGIWFPLILAFIKFVNDLFNPDTIFSIRLFSALYISAFIAFIAPALIQRIYPESRISFTKLLFFGSLIFIFWRNYFHYSLSDFPSFVLLSSGLFFLFSRKPFYILLSGMLEGIAFNIRPIYLIALFPMLILAYRQAPVSRWNQNIRKVTGILYFLVGLFIISVPQMLVNYRNFNTLSPMLQTH